MISISSSASLEYYLEDAFEEIGADPKIGLRSGKKENYYAGSSNKADPLARPLTVGGPAATKLGLKHGQKLSAKQFENLYFGYTPDGRQPLHEKIKTKEEQTAASKKVRACEVARDAGYTERRAALDAAEKRLGDKSLALTDPAVVEADAKIARAKAALDEARNEKNGYRRPGVDVVLSLPADMNILHASFLAQGKLDKAKKLEDFFNKAADRACEKLAAKCTSSSGGKDEKGKRVGEPVDVIWTSTTHFDARPDENGVVSHNIHRHANFLNFGRKEDGTWGAIRTEELEAARHEVDAELVASCTQFCVSEFGVDPTAKEFETGVLGVEFGAGRHLESLKEKPQSGLVSRLFGRKSEVQKNKEKGLSGSQLNRVGRQEKKKLTGEEHIAMQRELLAEAGLTLGKIKGSKKDRLADERSKAAERLTRQYDNEGKKWSEFERAHGFPDGKPKPFTGKKATEYIEFTKMVKERRAAGDKSVPPSPIIPPGEIGHSPAFWNECLDKAVKHEIKQQENLLDHVLRTAKEADKNEPAGGQRFIELNSTYTDAQTIQRQALRSGRQLTAEMQTGNWTAAFRTLKAGGMLETAATESECILRMCSDYKESMKKHVGDTPRLMAAWEEAKRTGKGIEAARARLEESLMSSAEGYRKNVMLSETNANVRALGAKARADLKELGLLGKEDTEIVGEAGKMKIAVGERLSLRGKLTTKDAVAYDSFLYTKGTQLTVVDIRKDKDGSPILSVRVDSADAKDGVVRLDIRAEDFKALAPATAMTVHLSQGGSWDNVGYLPSAKSTKPALLLVGMTRHKKALKTFVPESDVKNLEKKAQKTTRRPDALDYDELSEADLDTAVEVVSRATDRAVDEATKDVRGRSAETFEKAMASPEAGMAETAHALGTAASALKREDVAKAAKSGVVAIGENAALPHLAEDRRTWLAETSDSCFAYNPKTGRVEAWKKEMVDDARKTLAVRSEVHAKMKEAIGDAVPEAEEARKSEYDVRGELVARGVDPFKNVTGEKATAWAEIKKDDGEVVKIWGVDIGKALDEAGLKVGDGVSLNGDETKDVTVYSSKGDEGGTVGKLITPPSKKGPAEIALDGGKKKVKVYGAAGDAWKDAKPGDSVTVYSKTVEKRLWTAESHALPNKLDIEKRKAAWDAARRAVENDAMFDTLRAVGVGAKATANDSETDEKKRAIRNWTAGGDGADAVVEWDANLGPGQRAWHEVGRLEKGDDDIARADLTGVVLHDDGARVYYAVAVENGRGDVETAGQRILAFEKEDLGLSKGTCSVGSTHRIRCSDDEEKPTLLTPKDEIAFEPEAIKEVADMEAEFIEQAVQQMLDRLTMTELKELAERKITLPTEAQLREAAERPNETLSEVGLISDTPLMNDGMLKPTPEETAQMEAGRLAAEAIENARRTEFSERKAQAEAWAARVNAGEAKGPTDRQTKEEAEARAAEEANERRAQKELEYIELANDILSIKDEATMRKIADSLTEDEKDDMLLAAAKVGKNQTVEALIPLGFDAERTLHKAVSDGRASDVEALIVAGADPHKQVNGLTAAELADGLSENGRDAKSIDALLKEIGVAEPAAAATQTATQAPKARGPK